MKTVSRELEEKLLDILEDLYDFRNKNEYRFQLSRLEGLLVEYNDLTGKKHQVELNLVNLYVKMWKMR